MKVKQFILCSDRYVKTKSFSYREALIISH